MGTKTRLNYSDIPDRAFLPAIKVREIVMASPLSLDEKKSITRGSPDIRVSPLMGTDYFLTRNEILSNFTYINGKRIKTSGWEAKKQYLIYRKDNTAVAVMQVPLDHIVEVNGGVANGRNRSKGDYIVCSYKSNGTIDRQSAKVVSAAVFRKLCYVPTNEVIERHRGSKNRSFRYLANKVSKVVAKPNTSKPAARSAGGVQTNTVGNQLNRSKYTSNGAMRPPMNNLNTPQTGAYTIVAQVHDAFGKRVGFVIQNKSGDTKQIKKSTAIQYAMEKKISNVEVVRGQSGEMFLRGNGIKLETLPIEYV